jgi:hypothetical protein
MLCYTGCELMWKVEMMSEMIGWLSRLERAMVILLCFYVRVLESGHSGLDAGGSCICL